MTFRKVGIRLTEPLDDEVAKSRNDFFLGVAEVLMGVHMFDKAHVVMLAERKIIPREDAVSILLSLRGMEAEGVERTRITAGGGIHSGEVYLTKSMGESVAGR